MVLEPGRVDLGRSPNCQIVLDDAAASRQHARLEVVPDRVTVEDLGSANGTLVNGALLAPGAPRAMREGDLLTIGQLQLVLGREKSVFGATARLAPVPAAASRGAPESETESTSRRDPLELLGEVADRLLAAGGAVDAARILGPEIERVARGLTSGRSPGDAPIDWAVEYSLRLATATHAGRWLDQALGLLASAGRPPGSDALITHLEAALRGVDGVDSAAIEAYEAGLRRSGARLDRQLRPRVERVEALLTAARRRPR